MKTGIFLLGTFIVTCSVTSVSGRKPNPLPANGAQDYGCAVIAVNTPTRARPMGIVRIPGPAATFLEIGLWARDRWHRFWADPLDRQDCVLLADSPD